MEEQVADLSAGLYAASAVLMDADTGRVLFEKNGYEVMPNASTTKIMTCLVALEHADLQSQVTFSEKAAAQPKVKLGAAAGSTFYLKDLLIAMMLESYNDVAMAVAESIGGSQEQFADMMNEKAKEIGCTDTHFVTPNGLDETDAGGAHGTTARDLALIMSACIENEQFLEITQMATYSFSSCDGTRQYSVSNKNAFLNMMDGVLSGKTGFTGAAGYCYVCALRQGERTFTVALLACGWPNNKTYKWKDTAKLMQFGLDHYEKKEQTIVTTIPTVTVENGYLAGSYPSGGVTVSLEEVESSFSLLLSSEEQIRVETDFISSIAAPVSSQMQVGVIRYYLGNLLLKEQPVYFPEAVLQRNFKICLSWVWNRFLSDIFSQ